MQDDEEGELNTDEESRARNHEDATYEGVSQSTRKGEGGPATGGLRTMRISALAFGNCRAGAGSRRYRRDDGSEEDGVERTDER